MAQFSNNGFTLSRFLEMTELLKNTEGLNLAHLFIDWNPIHKDNYKMLPA